MVKELLKKCRSYRRFDNTKPVTAEQLKSFVECARYTASGANRQQLRFSLVSDKASCDKMFSAIKLAGYLTDWKGPTEDERPTAYVIISSEFELTTVLSIDLGIVSEAITLAAAELGIGSCMIRSFNPKIVSEVVDREGMTPYMVIALGYPSETVILEDSVDGNIKYYRDSEDRHIVPKLPLDTLIL